MVINCCISQIFLLCLFGTLFYTDINAAIREVRGIDALELTKISPLTEIDDFIVEKSELTSIEAKILATFNAVAISAEKISPLNNGLNIEQSNEESRQQRRVYHSKSRIRIDSETGKVIHKYYDKITIIILHIIFGIVLELQNVKSIFDIGLSITFFVKFILSPLVC